MYDLMRHTVYMSKQIVGTKSEIQALKDWVIQATLSDRPVKVENDMQHKAALQLVEAGHAVITKKKNYGRIAEIKAVQS